MFESEFTFDRFVRLVLMALGVAAAVWLTGYLSSVLLPFFIAWFIAYMINPVVEFVQHRLHLHFRMLSVTVVVLLLLGLVVLLVGLALPPFLSECAQLKNAITAYIQSGGIDHLLPSEVKRYIEDYLQRFDVQQLLGHGNVMQIAKVTLPQVWNVFVGTAGFVINLLSGLICLLYIFLILLDYDNLSRGWINFVPVKRRSFARTLMGDVQHEMNSYFRGQALCAICVGILFWLGFWLIGLPMAGVMGAFIGICYMVPYLQLIGFVPATILALLKASETGQSFWGLMLMVVVVYCVVQIISDVVLQPHIMGSMMNISPSLIFLSLTVWGYLLGIIGLIIALPLTSLITSYYRRYVIKEQPDPPAAADDAPQSQQPS